MRRPVRLAHPPWAHFVDHHGNAAEGDLPGGFASGQSATDDMYRIHLAFLIGVAQFAHEMGRTVHRNLQVCDVLLVVRVVVSIGPSQRLDAHSQMSGDFPRVCTGLHQVRRPAVS